MTRTFTRLAWGGLMVAGLMLSGCTDKPKYPNCAADADCAAKGEVCINKQCQECGDASQCEAKYPGEGRSCESGRCEAPATPECTDDSGCDDGMVCRDQACVPECTSDNDCGDGRHCTQQRCYGACKKDSDCGNGLSCDNGRCEMAKMSKISPRCQASGDGTVALQVVNFALDDYELDTRSQSLLRQNAECLNEAPELRVVLEGHCDDRGTQEYNLALGEKRANTVRAYLKALGVSPSRLTTRSYGENRGLCSQASEDCWSRNRRVEFVQR